jgi:drug/metabolite transporter (DMT)-like permease
MWFALAFSAAMLWGLTYAISGRLLKDISVPTMLFISSAIGTAVMFVYALSIKRLGVDLRTLASSRYLLLLFAGSTVAYILANLAISYSIVGRNATLAAVIEIAYPLSTALAAWLLFGEKQFTLSTLVGGLLIVAGSAVIVVAK